MQEFGISDRKPLLTIVTAHLDDAYGLARTYESFRGRRPPYVEHIVIDGSVTKRVVEKVASATRYEPSRVIPMEPRGVYEAMNGGIQEAQGHYTFFLNAGDSLSGPGVLEQLALTLSTQSIQWLYCRVLFSLHNTQTRYSRAFDYLEEKQKGFRRGRFPLHPGTVVKTALLRQMDGFDSRFLIAADYHLMLRLAMTCEPTESDLTLTNFALGGLSTTRWLRSLKEAHDARVDVFALGRFGSLIDHVQSIPVLTRAWGSRLAGRV